MVGIGLNDTPASIHESVSGVVTFFEPIWQSVTPKCDLLIRVLVKWQMFHLVALKIICKPISYHWSLSIPLETSETSGMAWVNILLSITVLNLFQNIVHKESKISQGTERSWFASKF